MNKVYEYGLAFYNALNDAATTEDVNGKDVRIFRGSITEQYRKLGVSQSHYSEVRKGLINGESITILQRGSRGNESIVVIHFPPTEESFISGRKLDLTKPETVGNMLVEIAELKRLLGKIDVPKALINLEQRLAELEIQFTRFTQVAPKPIRKGDT